MVSSFSGKQKERPRARNGEQKQVCVETVFFFLKTLSTFRCAQTLKNLFIVALNQRSKTFPHHSTLKSGNTKC